MGRRKVEEKKGNIFFKIIGIINLLVAMLFILYIFSLNILPNKYFYPFAGIVAIISILTSLGIMKTRKNKVINIISMILAIVFSLIYFFAYDYARKGFEFVDVISEVKEQYEEYYVVTLKENNYETIDDLKSKKIFKFVNTLDNFDVINEIKSKGNFKFSDYSNLHLLKDELLSKKIESIFLSSSEFSILSEEDEKFKENTLKIFTAKHKVTANDNLINKDDDLVINKGKFNVYISGIDTSGRINNVSRTDANILLTVNTDTREILMTSIPRDYYVTLHSKKAKDKLTHSGIYGINETINTVSDLLETDINYYFRVNFSSVIKVIDAIGGVDVYSDYYFKTTDDYGREFTFKKGYNHLNGVKALSFARERYSFNSGDNQRVKNQQKVVEAVINKITSSTTLLTKYTSILNSLSRSFQTNISKEDISSLVKEQLNDMGKWKITSNSLTGRGAHASTFSAGSQKLYVMIPNEESVNNAKKLINTVLKK